MRRVGIALALLIFSVPVSAADIPAGHQPDPNAVRRYGPAYRYPQAGWVVLHVEGDPYPRGYQHGWLMAAEITAEVRTLSEVRSAKTPADGWSSLRTMVNALFLRKFDREYLEEMKGIAEGAAAAGAKFDGRTLDLLDIVCVNTYMEWDVLDTALAANPHGLEGVKFPVPKNPPAPKNPGRCSAFAATGPATADGKIVFGHITMSALNSGPYVNVWIDIVPTAGRRVVMQAFPGGIWSSQDFYMNDAGVLLAETTLDQTKFDPEGTPLTNRARKAIQYSENIDTVVKLLSTKNNGLYTNEWLIADIKTNEIALFELGTHKTKLRRSSKDEWFGGTRGFYWGCNNGKDPEVRRESIPAEDRPENLTWVPDDRDTAWLKLFEKHNGKIDAAFGKLAFTTPPLAASISLDAKFTTADLAKDLAAHAVYGPPLGKVWQPTFEERTKHPAIKPLVPHPWTVLTVNTPPVKAEGVAAIDLPEKVPETHLTLYDRLKIEPDPETEPAWAGPLVAKADADLWLAGGFAGYERIVALEHALKEKSGGKLTPADAERIEAAVFDYRAKWLSAKKAAPDWRTQTRTVPPTELMKLLDGNRFGREQTGFGVVTLHALRKELGAETFDKAMADFGRAHNGKVVTTLRFATALNTDLHEVIEKVKRHAGDTPAYSTHSFLDELDSCVIVYGTRDETAANKEAALHLQERVRRRWSNVILPVVSDKDASSEMLTSKHLLLVGRPATNRVAAEFANTLPVRFTAGSFALNGDVYAHPDSAVIAAGVNPKNPRYSVVLLAGLSAAATYHVPTVLMTKGAPAAEVLVCPADTTARTRAVTR